LVKTQKNAKLTVTSSIMVFGYIRYLFVFHTSRMPQMVRSCMNAPKIIFWYYLCIWG